MACALDFCGTNLPMENLLRGRLTKLVHKIWPDEPAWDQLPKEILQERARFQRLYNRYYVLFVVSWAAIGGLFGYFFQWLYHNTLQLPGDTLAWIPVDWMEHYLAGFFFGMALTSPVSNACMRSELDSADYQKLRQFIAWKDGTRTAFIKWYVLAVLLFALPFAWYRMISPFVVTPQKVLVRDGLWPKCHEKALRDIRAIDHYDGYVNRYGRRRGSDYYELVTTDGKTYRFAFSDGVNTPDTTNQAHVLRTLRQLTGLEIREMGWRPFK